MVRDHGSETRTAEYLNVVCPAMGVEASGGVHVIVGGDVCQLREAFGSSRRQ